MAFAGDIRRLPVDVLVAVTLLVAAGCYDDDHSECGRDGQCEGARVCESGTCLLPSEFSEFVTEPTTGDEACGEEEVSVSVEGGLSPGSFELVHDPETGLLSIGSDFRVLYTRGFLPFLDAAPSTPVEVSAVTGGFEVRRSADNLLLQVLCTDAAQCQGSTWAIETGQPACVAECGQRRWINVKLGQETLLLGATSRVENDRAFVFTQPSDAECQALVWMTFY